MKQKFTFEVDTGKNLFIISEASEGETGFFAQVSREEYDLEDMKEQIRLGRDAFIEKMRRINFFPPFDLSCRLFDAAETFLSGSGEEKMVVAYDDIDSFPDLEEIAEMEEPEDEYVEIGDLLKDEKTSEDLSEDDIKEIDSDDDTPKFQPDDTSEHEN